MYTSTNNKYSDKKLAEEPDCTKAQRVDQVTSEDFMFTKAVEGTLTEWYSKHDNEAYSDLSGL
jgi:hypothetical protein